MSGRWKIDDTTRPGRVFCEHLARPRLTGELLPSDRVPDHSWAIPAPGGLWLANLVWPDGIGCYEEQDMYDSLAEALKAHDAAKTGPKPSHAAAAG
jgi:hypothetical protein